MLWKINKNDETIILIQCMYYILHSFVSTYVNFLLQFYLHQLLFQLCFLYISFGTILILIISKWYKLISFFPSICILKGNYRNMANPCKRYADILISMLCENVFDIVKFELYFCPLQLHVGKSSKIVFWFCVSVISNDVIKRVIKFGKFTSLPRKVARTYKKFHFPS